MKNGTKRVLLHCAVVFAAVLLGICLLRTAGPKGSAVSAVQMDSFNAGLEPQQSEDDYRTTYEIFVGSFSDSNEDGTGDLEGIRRKLDYIQETGFDQIWLTPVFPSDTYHKYDVKDYCAIDPAFGTLDDFDRLLNECHSRGIRVLLDLPLNHTSSSHPWFLQAAEYMKTTNSPEQIDLSVCPYAGYYRFEREASDGYAPLGDSGWYYEARFWSEMPDLNLDSAAVRSEIRDILSFWLARGVDGFRLDAVTSYYTGNQDANTDFLRFVCSTCREIRPDCYLVGEAWADRSTIAGLYESGIDSLFDFPFGDQSGFICRTMRNDLSAEDFVNAMILYENTYAEHNPDHIDAPFYTNHDMGRSAGYYALDDGPVTKMAYALNLFMRGNVFVYYGEDIGMKGSGRDENKRYPMQWGEDDCTCDPVEGTEDVEMKFPSLEDQLKDELSVYHWFRETIRVRNSFPVIARGTTAAVDELCSDRIAAFIRWKEGLEPVLIIMNLSAEQADIDTGVLQEPLRLSAVLNTDEEQVRYEKGILHLPGCSIAVLTENE
ncbi:MAG: hypothetical protein IKF51_02055 [Solobacterium sp.]|nr:hypothetical protein [Solobacterium sp.]